MIKEQNSSDRVVRQLVLLLEVALIMGMMTVMYLLFWQQTGNFPPHFKRLMLLMGLSYCICNLQVGMVVHERFVTGDQILARALRTYFSFALLSLMVLWVFRWPLFTFQFMCPFYLGVLVVIVATRYFIRQALKSYRSRGGNTNYAVFVGPLNHIPELLDCMVKDPSTGYTVLGYFADEESRLASNLGIKYLGTPSEVPVILNDSKFKVDQLFCTLSSTRAQELNDVINYCESHLVRFYDIPSTFNYMKHTLCLKIMANTPVFSMHNEPLESPVNRFFKRAFDIVFALLVLTLVFPWVYIIFGTWIKLTSPGPVFFRQKRSGLNGKEFYCYKFRSMRVNADSDRRQATKDDPRKTRVGELMRKTSIDELPQFLNVLRGEMSVVGPRPHMVAHTEQYSEIISNYMVRHFVKPGITGYAQVTGYRGETSELWQMEGRVQRDIWYIEHWSLALDMFIIFKTIANAILGEEKAY